MSSFAFAPERLVGFLGIAAGAGSAAGAGFSAGFAAALAGTPAKQKTTMNFIVDGTADIMVEVTG